MSKAFTRESDYDPSIEVVARPRDPLPAGVKNYITPAGAAALRQELRALMDTARPALLRQIRDLVASDRRNGRAHREAKHRLRQVELQTVWLEERIASLEIVDAPGSDEDRIRFGATVTVADEDDGQQEWRIVGVDEADPAHGSLSWISPIARALLSHQVGDEVEVALPRGGVRLEILAIEYP